MVKKMNELGVTEKKLLERVFTNLDILKIKY